MDAVACLFCSKNYPHDPFSPFCPDCGEPLLLVPLSGPCLKTIPTDRSHPLEKFSDFLPLRSFDASLSLGEGNTPLVPLGRLGPEIGIPKLFAKNEAQNPTSSFKDRGTAVAIQKAVTLSFKKIGTVSTGNMAASTAAYGARAGLKTYVLLKEGTSRMSLPAAGIFGPTLITVRGDYGRLFYRSLEIGKKLGIYFMNSIDPFRVEGYKVTGFEIFLQLGGRQAPRFVFVPVSSGGHLLGLMRAFEDLERAGLARGYPTFVGVQAEGCAPLVRAFGSGKLKYERLSEVRTIAHAISNPAPPAGNAVLKLIRDHAGILMSVSDDEMVAAQRALAAAEGLFCQPESAVTLAGLLKLREKRILPADGSSVLVLTGSGLKAPYALDSLPLKVRELDLDDLEQGLDDPA
ncbi:MAG: threonine synthase [Candidatus Aminicenantales bacterium]|jgi:threonine synthase